MERGLLAAHRPAAFGRGGAMRSDMLAAVDMIAHRRRVRRPDGRGLANGWPRGSGTTPTRFTVEVKGQELPLHEPRLKFAMGVGSTVAPVGADHLMNMHDTAYTAPASPGARQRGISGGPLACLRPGPRQDGDLLSRSQLGMHFQDCAVICQFYPYKYRHMAEALSGVTGHVFGACDMLAVGERARTLARLFNLREGFTSADDRHHRCVPEPCWSLAPKPPVQEHTNHLQYLRP